MTIAKIKIHGRDVFMVSKKLKRAILSALVLGYVIAPPPAIQAAEPVSIDSQEIDVQAGESNEDFLNYLELTDYFVMSAERIPTSRWDTPANVTVITSDEIEKNHYADVAEALSHVNGVVVTAVGRRDTSGYVSMNGTGRVLLLIDGHRANIAQGMYAGSKSEISDLTIIPSIKIVDRIEIVKGAASALYGSDAVGGIINIITKKGERNETEVDVNYGSWKRYNLEATNQGVKGKLGWFVTAGFGKSDPFKYNKDWASYTYRYSDYEDRDLSIRLDDQFSDRNSLSVNYMHRTHDFSKQAYSNPYYVFYNSASIEYKFKEDTSTPGWLRYFNNYQKGRHGEDDDFYYSESKLQGLEYQNGWEIGDRHKLIAGAEWHRVESESPSNGYDEKVDTVASYIQDTISLGNKWTVVPGLRYDHTKDFGGNWAPKIAANYRADDKTKIYASYGRTYRVPTIGEMYTNYQYSSSYYSYYLRGYRDYYYWQLGGAYSELANLINTLWGDSVEIPNIKPEKGYGATIGIEHDFDDKKSASLDFFTSKVDNAIAWESYYMSDWTYGTYYTNSTSVTLECTENAIEEKRNGFELSYRQNINDNWSYDLGYSRANVKNTLKHDYTNPTYYGQPNGYRVGVHYNDRKWRANLLGVMASGRNTAYYDSGSYVVLDFNTGYDFTDRVSAYFRVLNFTNDNYENSLGDNGENSYYNYETSPGRFFQIGATYKF